MYDSRMNLNSLFTATQDDYVSGMKGIALANYVTLKDFVKDGEGQIKGAVLRDLLSNTDFEVECRVAVNCAGISADTVRQLGHSSGPDSQELFKRIQGSRGTHLMFKRGTLPKVHGVIIPKTKDGRLIYIIDYMGHPMVGTTDVACENTHHC
mmetsp:Transcript_8482/g.14258  ORF Transcript_8482/g.14258 Transcript_8482/m.14258 type:complete len:152 (-) Transcript_8482:882-1337(-)